MFIAWVAWHTKHWVFAPIKVRLGLSGHLKPERGLVFEYKLET